MDGVRRLAGLSAHVLLLGLCAHATSCEPKSPERAHPGCPGNSFRSATSETDCICEKGEVLRAGAQECKSCNPVPSGGIYCECNRGNMFSFDGSLEAKLSLDSEQVSCGPASECEFGERYEAGDDECVPCSATDCGGTCWQCPIAMACVSGQCVAAEVCQIDDIDFGAGSHSADETCGWGEGEITSVEPFTLLPGSDCSFADETCVYTADLHPLGGFEPSCPKGAERSDDDPELCVCKDPDEVLFAGLLDCESCDPVASRGLYCDCGENAVFSNHWLLETVLPYPSSRAECGPPLPECPDGQTLDLNTGECAACDEVFCGKDCPCPVGSTCISGVCADVAAGRIRSVLSSATGRCLFKNNDLLPLGSIRDFVPGERYAWPEFDGCQYEVEAEALSR